MSTNAVAARPAGVGVRRSILSIYVVMALLFIVVAVVGFAPRSIAIVTGTRPSPPLMVHLHAAVMTAWLLLFLAQAVFMANRRPDIHKSMGLAAFFLGSAMFVLMSSLVARNFLGLLDPATAPPVNAIGNSVAFQTFIMARAALLFGLFFFWAIAVRKSAPESHKRLMILATFIVIDAAIARVPWLPGAFLRDGGPPRGMFLGYDLTHLYQLLLMLPVLAHDILTRGRVHQTYVIGISLFLLSAIGSHFAWNSPTWQNFIAGLLGMA